ncbi:MAG: hypothetical protein RLZZ506_625 [Bacteroidota bacterium]
MLPTFTKKTHHDVRSGIHNIWMFCIALLGVEITGELNAALHFVEIAVRGNFQNSQYVQHSCSGGVFRLLFIDIHSDFSGIYNFAIPHRNLIDEHQISGANERKIIASRLGCIR